MENIFTYTEPTPINGYPSYLSINHIATENDRNIVFTVRSSGNNGSPQEVRLTPQMCESLVDDLNTFLNGVNSLVNKLNSKEFCYHGFKQPCKICDRIEQNKKDGICPDCEGEGEQGGQFCGGYWKCESCGGTGKNNK